jgi:maltooligosyltrehalose trehalohydrolase
MFIPYHQFIVFTQNHDQIGNRLKGERLSSLVSFDALKLAAAAMLLTAHTPMLFMGEEYGETNPFLFFTDHSDPELIARLRAGRKEEFASFNWEDEVPDPQSPEEQQKSMLSWNTATEKATILTRYYSHLISLRKNRPALRNSERNATIVEEPAGKLVSFERRTPGEHLLVLLNFSESAEAFNEQQYPALKKVFDSSEEQWSLGSPQKKSSFIPPYTAIVYEVQSI